MNEFYASIEDFENRKLKKLEQENAALKARWEKLKDWFLNDANDDDVLTSYIRAKFEELEQDD